MQNYLITNREPSATKKGPGRYHKAGHKKSTPPRKGADFAMGFGTGFRQHLATEQRRDRRALVKTMGRRQAIKHIKRVRRDYGIGLDL